MRNITYFSTLSNFDFEVGKVYDDCEIFCAYNLPHTSSSELTQEHHSSATMKVDCTYTLNEGRLYVHSQ